ncbi:MAG: HAMP domain-containing histidine kinase [Myxococcales bacterium]|nr:HAMP domain-containing histidine kinase [Myxococcales bacterium]
MRLLNRLLISHLVPVLVVTCALGLTLTALVRISSDLDDLERSELVALRRESELHRAAWTLDVSMRHGEDDCREGRPPPAVAERIAANRSSVASTLAATDPISPPMHRVIEGYLDVADELLAKGACVGLLTQQIDSRREELDEELTNLWIDRLDELHEQITARRSEARRTAGTAVVGGAFVAVAATLFALFVAAWLARVLTRPLRILARSAQRVGRGDFATPVQAGGPVEVVELVAELERMRLQLEELEMLKQGFLASISHELRTPLSKIREALALLQDGVVGPLSEVQREVLAIARSACEREIRLVITLLDLSRLRAGSPMRPRDGASIDDVLLRAVDDERVEAEPRGVDVKVTLEGDAPRCRMDPILVERAIANLVRNAVAVSPVGQPVSIVREVVARAAGDLWIRIAVSDRGPGVPREIRESMFETFVTRPVPNSSKGIGFGLGLALSREVARVHRGELSLHASSSAGATFHLWLPLDPAPD